MIREQWAMDDLRQINVITEAMTREAEGRAVEVKAA